MRLDDPAPHSAGHPAQTRTSVLVTGFGPFPGVPVNATMRLVPELVQAARHALPGVRVASAILATEWAAAPLRLDALLADTEPDLVAPLRRVLSRARLRGRDTGRQRVRAAAGRVGLPAAGCGAARGQCRPSRGKPARASPGGPAAATPDSSLRLARRRRLSVQCVAVSLAAARQASARPPRRLHSYPREPRPARGSQPRAQRRLSAFVGPGAAGKPRDSGGLPRPAAATRGVNASAPRTRNPTASCPGLRPDRAPVRRYPVPRRGPARSAPGRSAGRSR